MNNKDAMNEIQLEMLRSLAKSQSAISRMLESVADVVEGSEDAAKKIGENLEVISNYQRSILVKLTGFRFRRIQTGVPAKPWLNQGQMMVCSRDSQHCTK